MWNKKQKLHFLENMEINLGNVSETCRKFKIPRKTVYNWINKNEWFKDAFEDIQESLIDDSESELYRLRNSGNVTAIIFHLKTKGKDRGWDEKREIIIRNEQEKNIDLSKLSNKEVNTYIKLMEKIQ